jgi:hypothetical protein
MNHYEEFGLSPEATAGQISQAHKNLARLLHPDNFQDDNLKRLAETQMKRLNAIYGVLSDPARRRMYNLQLVAPGPILEEPVHAAPGRRNRNLLWVIGTMLAVAGIYAALESQALDRTAPVAPGVSPGPVEATSTPATPIRSQEPPSNAEQLRRLVHETKELRQLLNRVVSERDQALARLSATRPQPAIAAAALSPREQLTPSAEIGRASATASHLDQQRQQSMAGTWIFVPSGRPSPNDLYPAEYIELVVGEQDSIVWGRYRARYRVTDVALSPEVEFRFDGAKGADRFRWTGNGGATGEVRLKLLSDVAVSVDWFTAQFGRQPTLSSGTAVLVRRAD